MHYSCLELHFEDGINFAKRDSILLAETPFFSLVSTTLKKSKKGHRNVKVQQTFIAVLKSQRQKGEVILVPVVGSFVLRYSPEAASLWSGSCGVQLSVVVYDKTAIRKRQFIVHSLTALVNIK